MPGTVIVHRAARTSPATGHRYARWPRSMQSAAALEPAIVFPDFIFTQILEARHYPGCIGVDPELIIRLLENTFREIARNGLKKIVIVNAHGGNDNLIHYLVQIQLASPR